MSPLFHRGRAETTYRQPCPSCSRQHFWVNVFCLCFACYWVFKYTIFYCTYITLTPHIGQISSKTEAKYIHWKMLSATGSTRLSVRSFCPPPVICCLHNYDGHNQYTVYWPAQLFQLLHWQTLFLKLYLPLCYQMICKSMECNRLSAMHQHHRNIHSPGI